MLQWNSDNYTDYSHCTHLAVFISQATANIKCSREESLQYGISFDKHHLKLILSQNELLHYEADVCLFSAGENETHAANNSKVVSQVVMVTSEPSDEVKNLTHHKPWVQQQVGYVHEQQQHPFCLQMTTEWCCEKALVSLFGSTEVDFRQTEHF